MAVAVAEAQDANPQPRRVSHDAAPTAVVDAVPNYLDAYKRRCAEEGCRANSAVMALFKGHPTRPLQQLPLANNYVGPKGFIAVLHIVSLCQTIETIDLRGNGLDNGAVIQLCRVLERHLGVSRLHLDSNPISMDAGHALMQLLSEKNKNIVECTVTHTDIFNGVIERINDAAAANHERVLGTRPQIAPAKPIFLRPASSGGAAAVTPIKPASISSTHASPGSRPVTRHGPNGSASDASADAPKEQSASRATVMPMTAAHNDNASSATGSPIRAMLHGPPPSLTVKKPKPPPPALASDSHARLTAEHRQELRTRYQKRAEQYVLDSGERSASSIAAEKARSELAALEAAQARLQLLRDTEAQNRVPQSLTTLHPKAPPTATDGNQTTPGGGAMRPRAARPQQHGSPTRSPGKPQHDDDEGDAVEDNGNQSPKEQVAALPAATSGAPKHTRFMIDGAAVEPERRPDTSDRPSASLQVDFSPLTPPSAADEARAAVGQPADALVVEATDHFKVLFNLGCRYYNERNLDAAYQSWSEALNLATAERNREWMQLLTHNLQALSYEVLLGETNKHVESGKLDDADRTLALAERVAKRARNAAWLADVARAKQRVLRGQFQRHHEAAQDQFEQLLRFQRIEVTEDDRYEEDGVLMQHTELYVNEWARMLLVKEAIEGWAEAFQRASEVGGQQGRAMQEVVDTAVQGLCTHMIERYLHFGDQGPSDLTSHESWGITPNERNKMSDLWKDITSKSRVLKNPRWDLLQAAQIGNLLFASHELTRALDQFRTMAQLAEQAEDKYLLAAAHYYVGSVHFQRSSFADAEAALRYSVELLVDLRREMPDPAREAVQHPSDNGSPASMDLSSFPTSAEHLRLGATPASAAHVRAQSAASSEPDGTKSYDGPTPIAAANLHYRAYYLLSRNLVESFKFAEALEMHERALVAAHCDVLHEKLSKNFNRATTDHIMCVANTMQSPLVYLAVHYRHEWQVETESYAVLERLYVWIVPGEADSKFLLVDVEKDHKVRSVLHLIDQARRALSVQTNSEDTAVDPTVTTTSQGDTASPQHRTTATAENPSSSGVLLQVPALQWRTPLHRLFRVLLRPVIDTIAAYSQYSNANGFVVIPHGFLWLVPFAALIDDSDRFVVENYTVTHGLCATQLAYSALAWKSACGNGSERRMVVSQPDAQASSIEPHLAFLSDSHRAEQEAASIAAQLDSEIITGTSTDAIKIPAVLPKARSFHISAPVIGDASRNGMTGGVAATTSFDHLGILHSADVAFARIRAELAFHTNVNVARNASFLSEREGSLGWMRALLGCGVACCVFPLWCTPDLLPVDFASTFYHELEKAGHHKSRACANTMRKLLSDPEHPSSNPRVWAPYIVLGFVQPLEKKREVHRKPPSGNSPVRAEPDAALPQHAGEEAALVFNTAGRSTKDGEARHTDDTPSAAVPPPL